MLLLVLQNAGFQECGSNSLCLQDKTISLFEGYVIDQKDIVKKATLTYVWVGERVKSGFL